MFSHPKNLIPCFLTFCSTIKLNPYLPFEFFIESVTQQWRKSAPPILSTSHCEFNGARLCAHTQKPSSWHPFTYLLNKWYVPSLCPELLTRNLSQSFLSISYAPYIGFPSINDIFTCASFFLCFFLSFSSHTFLWA